MTKDEDYKLLKIQVCALRVNIHCDGCKQKVKKLLQRIEGVYSVNIDAEQQKVTVSGSVDSATLIKKLVGSGKHAELWSEKSNQNQKQKNHSSIKDDKNNKGQKQGLIKGLEAFKNQHKFPAFSSEEDDHYDDDEDDDGDEEDLEEQRLRFLTERANQLRLHLRQQAAEANNGKTNSGGGAAMAAGAAGGGKMVSNGGDGNVGKKGNPSQNVGMKANPGGIDQKTMEAALKTSNPHSGNDIAAAIGNGSNLAAALSGNLNGFAGFQAQPNNGLTAMTAGNLPSSVMMNMNGFNHPSSSMMMNMQNRMAMQQPQPQLMYHRSPYIPHTTGFYSYNLAPYSSMESSYIASENTAAHIFSDENTSSCSIM
ncbi:hypothetical protein Nepgr_017022 [Nepenthes gracilis]|uniref:HMA domain-containing protein n=1 Tax=Nepenthes gracilis TaxID=150966 RepID=A0AAD3XSX0_NEPGR|nr:hypothetical protein Nepgr_017022 [Nepenthes gracilis]